MRKSTSKLTLPNLIIKILPFILFSCVYYNTFYNAEVNYRKAKQIIEQTPQQDSENDKIPAQAKKLLGQAIKNSNIVIDSYPESKYVDDAYFIIGKASFLRKELFNAEKHLKKIINLYPDSEYYEDAKIWLIYTYLKMGEIDLARIEMSKIQTITSLENKFLLNNISAEIAIIDEEPLKAYNYYNKCINMSSNKSQKTSIYLKLLNISKKYNHLDSSIVYLDKLSEYVSGSMKKDIKIEWIKYSREAKKFDDLLVEIDVMLGSSEYSSIYIKLELERAKIYLDQNDFVSAKIFLSELAEKYSRKNESAEALYHLGNIVLMETFDLPLALEYFEKSKKDRKSSLYGKRSRDMINRINEYKNLNQELDYLLKEDSPEDSFEEKGGGPMKNMMPKPKKTKVVTPDSLLFVISEKLLFDFERLEDAKRKYEELIENYEDSKFRPQALYVLNFYFPEENWADILESEYPESKFNLNNKSSSQSDETNIESTIDEIWDICDISYNLCSQKFLDLYNDEGDLTSLYFYAFINDKYLNKVKEAIDGYNKYIKAGEGSTYFNESNDRIDEIENNVYSSIELSNQKINYYYAVESLQLGEMLDSVLVKIDNTINGGFSNYKSSAQLIKTRINKLIGLKEQIASMNNDSLEVDSKIDSLCLVIAKIYQLDFMINDSAIVYYKIIVDEYPDSKFRQESIIALKDIDNIDLWKSYLTSEYPDSIYISDSSYKQISIIDEINSQSFISNETNNLDMLNSISDLFIVWGCKDSLATNYDSAVTDDDGSCIYPPPLEEIQGCTDSKANNYNSDATQDDGSCIYTNIKLDTLNKVIEINE